MASCLVLKSGVFVVYLLIIQYFPSSIPLPPYWVDVSVFRDVVKIQKASIL